MPRIHIHQSFKEVFSCKLAGQHDLDVQEKEYILSSTDTGVTHTGVVGGEASSQLLLFFFSLFFYSLLFSYQFQILVLTSLGQLSSFIHRNQENQSGGVTFVLLGFSEYPKLQLPLFLVFLTIYTVTVLGNLGMIVIIKINPKLHTPMYFFLSHLSFVDFCYSTIVTPKLLENLVVEDRTISFTGCIMQFFFGCIFVVTETFMLAAMAYDRFVAVCNPLLYTVVMSQKLCFLLVSASYSWGIACSLIFTCFLLTLSFCGNNFINNFGCEHAAIVAVSCSDPYINQKIMIVSATFNEISSLIIILTSYVFIFITVMKMPSTEGRQKAFSTCASHLTTITIFHGSILFLYCVPNSRSSWLMVKVASVFYTVVIPMLNPLIYSLRNKDVKDTAHKLVNTKLLCDEL
ncbi:olfactory receptor 5D13-like [Equus asinus]|uniref:olfactory receptor 5D13-like n=1 Tax=Equus asinus TaxID=9793 RepID=UPI0038F6D860